jgi:threonine/homoserine/homoserine lactone efflux protein
LQFFLEGALLGLSVSLLIGPHLFILTQASIKAGFGAGIRVAGGMWISDLIFIAILLPFYNRVSFWAEQSEFQTKAGLLGAGILWIFGIYLLINANNPARKLRSRSRFYNLGFWLRGFLVNSLNPFTIFFWFGIVTTIMITRNAGQTGYFAFTCGLLIVVITMDALKVYYADLLGKKLKPRVVRRITQVSGFSLIIFGIYLLIQTLA